MTFVEIRDITLTTKTIFGPLTYTEPPEDMRVVGKPDE